MSVHETQKAVGAWLGALDRGDVAGSAEIWIEDHEAALSCVQSEEYLGLVRPDEPKWRAFWQMVGLDSADRSEIAELYARHFYSLDGLTEILGGEADQNWADTFTADGEFSLVQANGEVVAHVRGTEELVRIYATFPDVQTTRHWMNNLVTRSDKSGVRGGCYIIALDIKAFPCRISRSGLYDDRLVKEDGRWQFQARKLILDPGSPAGEPSAVPKRSGENQEPRRTGLVEVEISMGEAPVISSADIRSPETRHVRERISGLLGERARGEVRE